MICLDSDFIIDYLKGKKEVVAALEKHEETLVTTEINVFEIFFGIYRNKEFSERERLVARDFFGSLEVLPFDGGCGEFASRILAGLSHKGDLIEQNDCFIASVMLNNGCDKIITRNKKHFSKIKNVKVIEY